MILLVCGALLLLGAGASSGELAVGDMAPDFELQGSDGKLHRLVELLDEGGAQGVVLAWFPKAFTGG